MPTSFLQLHDAPRRKRRPLARLDQVHHIFATRLAVVLLLDLGQQHKVEQDKHARRQQEGGALERHGHVRRAAPPPAVLHVDNDQGGEEAGERVQHEGQVDAVQEPDVVVAVDPAQPGVA